MFAATALISGEPVKPLAPAFNAAAHDFKDWPSSPDEGIFPLGFSKDGWFAYSNRKSDFETNIPNGQCQAPPCYNAVFMNIRCESECYSDEPTHENDQCYCRFGVSPDDFKRFAIIPVSRFTGGRFPIRALGDEYSIELNLVTDPTGSEIGSETRYSEVWLNSKQKGRKLAGTVRDHDTAFSETTRAIGWIQSPFENRAVIAFGFVLDKDSGGRAREIGYKAIAVDLESGFKQ